MKPIDQLATVNEKLHSSNDSCVCYIKGLLKGFEDSRSTKKK
jgi:hypothetical protein